MASDQFGNTAKKHLKTYQNAKILYCAVLENMFPVSSARQIDFLQIIGLLENTEIGRYMGQLLAQWRAWANENMFAIWAILIFFGITLD